MMIKFILIVSFFIVYYLLPILVLFLFAPTFLITDSRKFLISLIN